MLEIHRRSVGSRPAARGAVRTGSGGLTPRVGLRRGARQKSPLLAIGCVWCSYKAVSVAMVNIMIDAGGRLVVGWWSSRGRIWGEGTGIHPPVRDARRVPGPGAARCVCQEHTLSRCTLVIMMTPLTASPLLRSLTYLFAIGVCVGALLLLPRLEPDHASLTIHGLYDELGHLVTALVAAIGIRSLRLPVPIWAVLLGGLVLDMGHVMSIMGYVNALEGSSRNGSHSLAVVALLACLGFLDRRRANTWLGIAIGAVSHLWRDMGTGTVALMWPLTETVYGTSYSRYLAVLAGMAIAMVGSAALLGVHSQATASEPEPAADPPASPGSAMRDRQGMRR